jgi:hypothetical protein
VAADIDCRFHRRPEPGEVRSPGGWWRRAAPARASRHQPGDRPDDDLRQRVQPSTWSTTGCETRRRSAA